jgi:glycosyltransferase involved in cell wall biosynthesis
MKINIVTVNSGWILQKIAERTAINAPPGVQMSISHYPVMHGNNLYVDVQNCFHGKSGGIDIGLFTHVHENNTKYLHDVWFELDYVLHMSKNNMDMWKSDMRYRGTPMSVAMPGEKPCGFNFKKRRIGIAQRGKYEGKGFHFLLEVIEKFPKVVQQFDWMIVGNDWQEVVDKLKPLTFVTYKLDADAVWPDSYYNLYSVIDYLLIPSKWEGGPMSLLEAAAMGVPIISSKVGWAGAEIPVAHSFEPGDIREFVTILAEIAYPQIAAAAEVEKLSYKKYAQTVVDCFELCASSNRSEHSVPF